MAEDLQEAGDKSSRILISALDCIQFYMMVGERYLNCK